MAECYRDPVFFVREVLRERPTAQQKQALDALAVAGAKVAIASGHGIGKSRLLSWVALWFLLTRDNAKIPCTAPTAHQLDDILWGEMRECIRTSDPWFRKQFKPTRGRIEVANSNGFIVARTARPEQPEALQGFHGENILFIIDEAAGVAEKVFEVAYGALSTPNARAIMTGNPTLLSGFFHRIFHSDNTWVKFHFSCLDSPIVDPSFAESVIRDYGENSDAYRVRVLGEFPKGGENNIIPADAVMAALARPPTSEELNYNPVMGVDPAWMGTDRSVIALRRGPHGQILFKGNGLDGPALAEQVARFATIHNVRDIMIDATGVGVSCCDHLRFMRIPHRRVVFAATPDDPEKFFNRRAEIWWRMRDWLRMPDSSLRPEEGLVEDLISPLYGIRDSGKIYLESKEEMRKRGIRSPDMADALAITFDLPYELTAGTSRSSRPHQPRQNTALQTSTRSIQRTRQRPSLNRLDSSFALARR